MSLLMYRRLANLVVVIHTVVCVFFLVGAFLAWQYPWVAFLHVPLAIWVSAAFLLGLTCPLTPLENWFRRAGGEKGYEGSFVSHYLGKLAGRVPADPAAPSGNGRRNQIVLGVIFCVGTLALYGVNFRQYHDALWAPEVKQGVAHSPR